MWRYCLLLLICLVLNMPCASANNVKISVQVPYTATGSQQTVIPGEVFSMFIVAESREPDAQQLELRLQLPAVLSINKLPTGWHYERRKHELWRRIDMTAHYSQWFDLLDLKLEPGTMDGSYQITVQCAADTYRYDFTVAANRPHDNAPKFAGVTLPVNEYGLKDPSFKTNTIVLRDLKFERLKSLFSTDGSGGLGRIWLQPLTYMKINLQQQSRSQQVNILRAYIIDKNTQQPIAGLYTPGPDGTMLTNTANSLETFIRTEDSEIIIPLYIDERLLSKGEYILQLELANSNASLDSYLLPITLEQENYWGILIVCSTIVAFMLGVYIWYRQIPHYIATMQIADYIVIAMFAVISILVVNLPTTVLWGLLHIVLGPFASLITGLFSVVCMAALTIALLVLVPKQGVVTLFILVKLALSSLIFGRTSLLTIMTACLSCLLLEYCLWRIAAYSWLPNIDVRKPSCRQIVLIVLACALTKTLANFVNIQAMMVLYRLYYADWYIAMNILLNGCLYTAIGSLLGLNLGKLMLKLKDD